MALNYRPRHYRLACVINWKLWSNQKSIINEKRVPYSLNRIKPFGWNLRFILIFFFNSLLLCMFAVVRILLNRQHHFRLVYSQFYSFCYEFNVVSFKYHFSALCFQHLRVLSDLQNYIHVLVQFKLSIWIKYFTEVFFSW